MRFQLWPPFLAISKTLILPLTMRASLLSMETLIWFYPPLPIKTNHLFQLQLYKLVLIISLIISLTNLPISIQTVIWFIYFLPFPPQQTFSLMILQCGSRREVIISNHSTLINRWWQVESSSLRPLHYRNTLTVLFCIPRRCRNYARLARKVFAHQSHKFQLLCKILIQLPNYQAFKMVTIHKINPW